MIKAALSWRGLILAISILFPLSVVAQQQPEFKYELKGLIRDKDDLVIPGLPLSINGKIDSDTDINGEFLIPLSEGEYVLTSDLLEPTKFRAFLKISANGLNPGYLEFIVDSTYISCALENNGKALPRLIKSVTSKYRQRQRQ